MRVLHINANYITSALHQTMIDHLNTVTDVESRVFVPTYDKSRAIVKPKDYVTVAECFQKWDRLFYFHKQNKIIGAAQKHFDLKAYDCIHAYTLFTDGNAAMQLSAQYRIPYVVAVRNTDVNVFFKRMLHLRRHGVRILRNASAVFFLSPAYRETVLHAYVPAACREEIRAKSYIIPNGIDDFWHDHLFERTVLPDAFARKQIRCIYVGGIDRNKNTELTLRALEQLRASGWTCSLTAAGRILDRSVFDRLCQYASFDYVGEKTREELLEVYRNADLFIMPSHTETFGLVYAEAMSQGLPVIYTRGQGFDGQFEAHAVGEAVSDKDATEIADAVQRITENYLSVSSRCVRSVQKFNWDAICSRYQEIYLASITNSPKRG